MLRTRFAPVIFAILAIQLLMAGPSLAAPEDVKFNAIPADKVNPDQKALARETAQTLLINWNNGQYKPVSDDYTAKMKAALTPKLQEKSGQALKNKFGDFKSMIFAQAATSPQVPGFTVYRFKGAFTKTAEPVEIRVVVEDTGKIGGFWVKPWNDVVQ